MPYIEVLWFPGRDKNQKKILTKEIISKVVSLVEKKVSEIGNTQ